LPQMESAENRPVEIVAARPDQRVAAQRSVLSRRRERERCGIEILLDELRPPPAGVQMRIANRVGPLIAAPAQGLVPAAGDIERCPGLGGKDTVKLPAAQNSFCNPPGGRRNYV